MKELVKKLEDYGFGEWQILELLKKGRIKTSHGMYRLDREKELLKLDDEELIQL